MDAAPQPPLGRIKETLLVALIAAPFLFWIGTRTLFLDFWYDEMFSLKSYGFGPLSTVLTDYSTPNNHVLHNLLNWIWLRAAGVDALQDLLDRPWLVRVPPVLYSLGAALYVYRCGRRFFGTRTALLSLAVLLTTVPFFHFAAQARGYSLSFLLVAATLFYTMTFTRDGGRGAAVAAAACVGLLLWAIPSNLYFVLTLVAVFGGPGVSRAATKTAFHANRPLQAALVLAGGIVIAVVLYSPVLGDVVDNKFVRSEGLLRSETLTDLAPAVLGHFTSARWGLVALIAAGFVAALASRRPGSLRKGEGVLLLAAVLVGPFVLSFVRGDRPYERVFVSLAPVFALLAGSAMARAAGSLRPLRELPGVTAILVAAYGFWTFGGELEAIDRRLAADIAGARRSQGIYHHYALRHYAPRRVCRRLAEEADVVLFHGGDLAAMSVYLARHAKDDFVLYDPPRAVPPDALRTSRVWVVSSAEPAVRELAKRWGATIKRCQPADFHGPFRVLPSSSLPEPAHPGPSRGSGSPPR